MKYNFFIGDISYLSSINPPITITVDPNIIPISSKVRGPFFNIKATTKDMYIAIPPKSGIGFL